MIHAIAYVSAAVGDPDEAELKSILSVAHSNNAKHNITGLLLYNGMGTYIQLIEGDLDDINQLYERIKNDKRHERIHQIYCSEISERFFANWQMGFRTLNPAMRDELGFSPFMSDSTQLGEHLKDEHNFYKIINYFKKESQQIITGDNKA